MHHPNHATTIRAASLYALLRTATRAAHRRIDRHPILLPLLRPGLTRTHYEQVLRIFLNLHQTLQPAIAAEINRLHAEYELSDRIGWLLSDLANLAGHGNAAAEPGIDIAWLLPPIHGAPALIGALYVVEGSALGSRIIAKHLHTSLDIDASRGARFFNAWGDTTDQNWDRYWRLAATLCPPEHQADAAATAVALFEAIERGLDSAWERWRATENIQQNSAQGTEWRAPHGQ